MQTLDEFFADERRSGSDERRFGSGWRTPGEPGVVYSVFWLADTKELCALRSSVTDVKIGGGLTNMFASGEIWANTQAPDSAQMSVVVLGHVEEDELDARLDGWEMRQAAPDGFDWVRALPRH